MRIINKVSNQRLMNWDRILGNQCILHHRILFYCVCLVLFLLYSILCFSIFKLMPLGLTGLSVFFFQFRVFGSGQASGQGVSGLLYPGGHSLRRTPRRGKKKSCTAQILTGCLYLSCFTSPMELNWAAAEKETKSFTVKCHKQKRWQDVKWGIFWNTSHSV